jgi:hypothetical protein
MPKICPKCGNLNDEDKKFCITCGASFESSSDPSGSPTIPSTGTVAGGGTPDPNRLLKILAGAGIIVIVIVMIFLFTTNHGMAGILPFSTTPTITQPVGTPAVTPDIIIETSVPEPTPVLTENLSAGNTTSDTPGTSPTPTKSITCPYDRRDCGAECIDIMTDVSNCGGCGISCGSSQMCQQGVCLARCTYQEATCFDGCHNLEYDSQNCGICGNICPVGLECNKSVCGPPLPTVIQTYIG